MALPSGKEITNGDCVFRCSFSDLVYPAGGVVPSIRALPTQATSFLGNNLMPGNNVMPGNSNMLPINSNMIPRNSNMMPSNNNMLPGNMMPSNNMLPSNRFPAYMSSSSSVFLGRGNLAAQHAVTTTTSPQPHAGQSQHSSSLMDSHLFQWNMGDGKTFYNIIFM